MSIILNHIRLPCLSKQKFSQVEKLLSCGPDGLFLVKNSTEFAGDLTLCISYRQAVLSYRIRQLQDSRRFTVDNDQSFDDVNINQIV